MISKPVYETQRKQKANPIQIEVEKLPHSESLSPVTKTVKMPKRFENSSRVSSRETEDRPKKLVFDSSSRPIQHLKKLMKNFEISRED